MLNVRMLVLQMTNLVTTHRMNKVKILIQSAPKIWL
jgi:hypothetical protein